MEMAFGGRNGRVIEDVCKRSWKVFRGCNEKWWVWFWIFLGGAGRDKP